MSNIEKVQQMYAAFGRGAIADLQSRLSESVSWEYGVASTDVPWLQPHRGRADVAKFFEAVSLLQVSNFEPKVFFETGNIVMVLVDEDITVTATGIRILEEDQVHIWHFDDRGYVVRYRQRVDTHLHWSAYHGRST